MRLKKHMAPDEQEFNGRQLRQGWAEKRFGLEGESIVAFVGLFNPSPQVMALSPGCERFRRKRMLHLVAEHRHGDLVKLRLQQQLLLNVLKDKLNHRLKGDVVQRWCHDLYRESAQITASATLLTASSAIVYTGVNVTGGESGAKLWGLEDGHIDPVELAQVVMDQYIFEMASVQRQGN